MGLDRLLADHSKCCLVVPVKSCTDFASNESKMHFAKFVYKWKWGCVLLRIGPATGCKKDNIFAVLVVQENAVLIFTFVKLLLPNCQICILIQNDGKMVV